MVWIHKPLKIEGLSRYCVPICLIYGLCLSAISPDYAHAATEIIPIQFRSAYDVEMVVQGMLSPSGKITVDARTNSIVITDDKTRIAEVRRFLIRFDQPARQVKIRLRFHEVDAAKTRALSADAAISGDQWKVTSKPGKKDDGIEIHLRDSKKNRQSTSEFYVHVDSGSSAYILVGKDIPFRDRWLDLSHRYSRHRGRTQFKRIESGMEVSPVIIGNRAIVEITPRISHEVKGRKRDIIRFARASTRLTVPLDQWIPIGGADTGNNEVMRAILESGTGKSASSLEISFMVQSD